MHVEGFVMCTVGKMAQEVGMVRDEGISTDNKVYR